MELEAKKIPFAQRDIMDYEGKIWAIADLLLAASVKRSDFPTYMMPFFALVMLEGRMLNAVKLVESEEMLTAKDDGEEFKDAFLSRECGFNEYIVMQGKTLRTLCHNDTTFDQDFSTYLRAFDDELKKLLGIDREKSEQKFLNMDGIVSELRAKEILLPVVTAWAEIDLAPFSNSEITTLEEHIKRKWADISASTAGEQYTPDDIIGLIAEIVAKKVSKPQSEFIHVYDPTCGGANLLFGVADRLSKHGYKHIATYGSEFNDALYALAAIESRFRSDAKISYGNTLTSVPYDGREMDVVVANPPYGTKWTGYERDVKKDERGQFFAGYPSTSDGQLLFMQHILWQLSQIGIAVEVHNGSTLFSGDAGGGESNIRKYIFDHDWVEAIIQMPQQEFFNTGIYTYLWIMNKSKSLDPERCGRVQLIDASSLWQPLKKSKGDKRREIGDAQKARIVSELLSFKDSDISKVFPREHFYYNKQSLMLTELSLEGRSVCDTICLEGKAFELEAPRAIYFDGEEYADFDKMPITEVLALIGRISASKGEKDVSVRSSDGSVYTLESLRDTIVRSISGEGASQDGEDLGCGDFVFKATATKAVPALCRKLKVQIVPRTTGDYEIVPYSFDEGENERNIGKFMRKNVSKPFVLRQRVVGVEVNFNKEFYVQERKASVEEILAKLSAIDSELRSLEEGLVL